MTDDLKAAEYAALVVKATEAMHALDDAAPYLDHSPFENAMAVYERMTQLVDDLHAALAPFTKEVSK